MRFRPARRLVRITRRAVFATIVAAVVAITGFASTAHGHVPATDGWHDTTPHGATARDEGLGSCSICRLAHETSSGPVAPGTISEPVAIVVPRVEPRTLFVAAVPAREHAPRAPPRLASC